MLSPLRPISVFSYAESLNTFEKGVRLVSKLQLAVTAHYPPAVEERINNDYAPRRNAKPLPLSHEDLLALADGSDAMLVTPIDKLDAAFFEHISPSVKVIATYSVGLEHIDLRAASARKIAIAYTPGANADATADLTLLLMLGASRRAHEAQMLLRSGQWGANPGALLGWQMTGKVLGIVGMGRVGQAVAYRARGFGMEIHYTNPIELEIEDSVFHGDLRDLLRVSQFLTLNAPETPETHHLINAETLALLPDGAIVVNSARGGLIVDDDLIAALKSGKVAAAGLDVFEGEPRFNSGYLELKNAFMLPHIGSATVETRTCMGMVCLDNINAVLQGRPASSLVTNWPPGPA
jgi:lactate dehydrogenase-like 2-hydroxyacid dehydrogenase